jgi:hypothetical protein
MPLLKLRKLSFRRIVTLVVRLVATAVLFFTSGNVALKSMAKSAVGEIINDVLGFA